MDEENIIAKVAVALDTYMIALVNRLKMLYFKPLASQTNQSEILTLLNRCEPLDSDIFKQIRVTNKTNTNTLMKYKKRNEKCKVT